MFSFLGRKKRIISPAMNAQRTLFIPESLYRRMLLHCQEERPLEACGLLVGVGGQVTAAYATDNAHRSPVVYKVDDSQLLHVFREIQSQKQEIIGIYHSHVRTPPIPSRTDIAQATWPEAFYVIASLAQRRPQVSGWRIVDQQVTEHHVVVQADTGGTWYDLRKAVRAAAEPVKPIDIS